MLQRMEHDQMKMLELSSLNFVFPRLILSVSNEMKNNFVEKNLALVEVKGKRVKERQQF